MCKNCEQCKSTASLFQYSMSALGKCRGHWWLCNSHIPHMATERQINPILLSGIGCAETGLRIAIPSQHPAHCSGKKWEKRQRCTERRRGNLQLVSSYKGLVNSCTLSALFTMESGSRLDRQWPQLSRLRRAGAINISPRGDDSVCAVYCAVCGVQCAECRLRCANIASHRPLNSSRYWAPRATRRDTPLEWIHFGWALRRTSQIDGRVWLNYSGEIVKMPDIVIMEFT